MGRIVYYDVDDRYGLEKALHKLCECGHDLYQHGFVSGYGDVIYVSQCCICPLTKEGTFTCKQFKEVKRND